MQAAQKRQIARHVLRIDDQFLDHAALVSDADSYSHPDSYAAGADAGAPGIFARHAYSDCHPDPLRTNGVRRRPDPGRHSHD